MEFKEVSKREAMGKNPAKYLVEDFIESGFECVEVTWTPEFNSVGSASSAIRRAVRLAEANITVKVDGEHLYLMKEEA